MVFCSLALPLLVGCDSHQNYIKGRLGNLPTLADFSINGGADFTNNGKVTLTFQAAYARFFSISSTMNDCENTTNWIPKQDLASYTLPSENSLNKVYVRFMGPFGELSACLEKTITHDNVQPESPGQIQLTNNHGVATLTETPSVTFGSPGDIGSGVLTIEVRVVLATTNAEVTPWQPLENGASLKDLQGLQEGTRYVLEVRSKDRAGNVSDVTSSKPWGGDSTIEHMIMRPALQSARAVRAADIDGDGDLDLLVSDYNENEIFWFEQVSSLNFVTHEVTATAYTVSDLDVGDIDGDGDLDIITASWGGDLTVYKNDGDLNFASYKITHHSGTGKVFLRDLDGDGDSDILASGSGEDKTSWYENDGTGTFTKHIVDQSTYSQIYMIDFDFDGDEDFFWATGGMVGWSENDGSANFTSHSLYSLAVASPIIVGLLVADLDGDSDLDVVFGDYTPGTAFWLKNDGNSNFAVQSAFTKPNYLNTISIADFDGDGDLDLVSGNASNRVDWHENNGSGSFTSHVILGTTNSVIDHITGSIAVDIDQDNHVDFLATGTANQGRLVLFENEGDKTFTTHTLVSKGKSAWGLAVVDVDGDGDLDIVSPETQDNRLVWHENLGNSNYATHVISSSATNSRYVVGKDLDQDGDMDIIASNSGGNAVVWYENDGNQVFSLHTVYTCTGPRNIYVADVDKDGDYDIVSTCASQNKVMWHKNDGSQSFTHHTVATATTSVWDANVSDVDSDGDLDIVTVSTGKVAWHRNNGSQVFTEVVIDTSLVLAVSGKAVDLDGDGDIDILVSDRDGNTFNWYDNDSTQNFSKRIMSSTVRGAYGFDVKDVDNDNDLDIVLAVAPNGTKNLVWFENDGAQAFTQHDYLVSASYYGLNSAICMDADGDGDLDVFTVSQDSGLVAWYELPL
jgi:hypothetical protein